MANDPTAFNAIVAQIQNNQIADVSLYQAGITDADCIPLANALKNSTSVKSLGIGQNSIGASGASSLAGALQVNTVLEMLYLGYNSIGDSGASSLASALQMNTALQTLYLHANSIGDSGASSLAGALRVNSGLTMLELSMNVIGYSGASSLAAALKINTKLQFFYPQANPIGDIGYNAFLQALTHNYRLMYIEQSSNSYRAQINALLTRNEQCAGTQPPTLQCPLLKFNPFSVKNAERLLLTPAYLQITNVNDIPLNGNFSISNITHCEFLNVQSQSITIFSQTDINNGAISLQHDGSGIAPSFNVTASYNDLETWPIPAVVNFTLVPLTSSTTTSSSSTSTASTTPFTTTRLTSTSTTTPTSTPFTMSSTSTASTTPFTSTSRPATTSVAATSVGKSSANMGAIIGGAAAGVAVLGAAVFALQRYRRKSSLQIAVLPTTADAMVANPVYNSAAGAPQHPAVEYDYVDPGTLPRPPQRSAWDPTMYATDEPVRERTSTQWEPRRYEVARHLRLPVNQESQYDTVDDELA